MPRESGILLPIFSLPDAPGIGDLGPAAFRFADFLAAAGLGLWQILPLNHPGESLHPSPYNGISAFAGNPWLLSPGLLREEGWLTAGELEGAPAFPPGPIDYPAVARLRRGLWERAFERFRSAHDREDFERFERENAGWLEDFSLFAALRGRFPGVSWADWPRDLRDRDPAGMAAAREELDWRISREKFEQYAFFRQWFRLKEYCRERGIRIIGDATIYVDFNSADVWAHPEIFKLDANRRPRFVSGVPPDYFSATGQLWGNPVYDWEVLKAQWYRWWLERLAHNFRLFDLLRLDHFRGFAAYWEIPAGEREAVRGRWVEAPGVDFFGRVRERFPDPPIIAEDLGMITPEVVALKRRFGFPGMKVMLFAFDDDEPDNPHRPENHEENAVVYTGTHDNNTARGWFEEDAAPEARQRLFRRVGREVGAEEAAAELVRLALASRARLAIIPMQDLLGLGSEARMNRPATAEGNYRWRVPDGGLSPELGERLRELARESGRQAVRSQE